MHDIWNPWHGCTKCSQGCKNCYMYTLDKMRGVNGSNVCHKTGKFKYPLMKHRSGEYKIKSGERIRVNMTSDTFLADADEWRDEMWSIIKQRPDVIFWILTKRPERIKDHLPDDWCDGYDNVSLNITCENQEMFGKRIDYLLDVPSKHKGLCLAPLLSDIDISKALASGQIDEVAVGGENYDNPRYCKYDWVVHIAETCRQYRTNFCWYETGTHLVINDIYQFATYNKHEQMVAPFFAGLNQKYYDIDYILRDSEGNILDKSNLREKRFNLNHCLFCSNQQMCNGCSVCGDCCVPPVIVSEDEFKRIQAEELEKIHDFYRNQQ